MGNKNNLKSIRLSDHVMNYIQNYRGNGFNEKFENIILDAMESEDERIKQLELYDEKIELVKKRYYKMYDQLRQLEPTVQACVHVNRRIKELNKSFDMCISKMDPDVPDLQKKCDTYM